LEELAEGHTSDWGVNDVVAVAVCKWLEVIKKRNKLV
jgi:hypothetical protein